MRSTSWSCEVLTLFPDAVEAYLSASILGRARARGLIAARAVNIRDFAGGKHKVTDDQPYGGGAGMVMKPEPIFEAVECLKEDGRTRRIIVPTPQGRLFDQRMAEEIAREARVLTFVCGRYEGIDERVLSGLADDEVSIGDFVLTGGELPALAIIDAAVRLIPGVLGDDRSPIEDSFSSGLLDYPHFTRPVEYRGMTVPEVLLSGNHREIERWRRKESLRRTWLRRPDLLMRVSIGEEDEELLKEVRKEEGYEQNHRP